MKRHCTDVGMLVQHTAKYDCFTNKTQYNTQYLTSILNVSYTKCKLYLIFSHVGVMLGNLLVVLLDLGSHWQHFKNLYGFQPLT